MSDELVTGVVIGDERAVVGGIAKLGANGTWKAVSPVVKLRTDEGHEVELVEIARATIDPVVTRTSDWKHIASSPGAALFSDEAPAPDARVDWYAGLIRGGDRIAAWGAVREQVLEGAEGGAYREQVLDGAEGGAYREIVRRRVVVMTPSLVFLGDDCVERLERLRATPPHVPLRPPPIVAAPPIERRAASGRKNMIAVVLVVLVVVVGLVGALSLW